MTKDSFSAQTVDAGVREVMQIHGLSYTAAFERFRAEHPEAVTAYAAAGQNKMESPWAGFAAVAGARARRNGASFVEAMQAVTRERPDLLAVSTSAEQKSDIERAAYREVYADLMDRLQLIGLSRDDALLKIWSEVPELVIAARVDPDPAYRAEAEQSVRGEVTFILARREARAKVGAALGLAPRPGDAGGDLAGLPLGELDAMLNEFIAAYARENGLSYGQAYADLRQHPDRIRTPLLEQTKGRTHGR